MSGRNLSLIGVFATVFLLCLRAYGQGGATGAIGGAVLDSKGAPIPKAQVEIRVAGSSTAVRTVFADGSGNFTGASLPVNAYDMEVSAPLRRILGAPVKLGFWRGCFGAGSQPESDCANSSELP